VSATWGETPPSHQGGSAFGQLPGVADGEDAADALAVVPGDATPDLRTLTAD
jgi:hypothetical protein